ncbi:MAG: beta-lactamase family protein [Pirellulaceae bacterium]|nr:beta-lactamase family protein [Pirellulaceae bacterium]
MRFGFFALAWLFTVTLGNAVLAQSPVSSEKIEQALRPFIDDNTVAGIVAMVAGPDEVLSQVVLGKADIESDRPMQPDSIFWIASMSKPVTAVCIMQMVDEGKLSLDDPIAKHLPDMSQLKTSDGQPAEINIRHLLTHTSGMAELPFQSAYTDATLADVAARYANVRVSFTPGSRWQYSQTSINTAGRIVEVLSGMSFDQYVHQQVCQPLGMVDTAFYLSHSQAERLAKAYSTTPEGLKRTSIILIPGGSPTDRSHYPAPNGGLFSTAGDYLRFCQMLLGGGQLKGQRILSERSVKELRTIATGDLKTGFTEGNGWGIGCCVIREPQGVTATLSPGTFGHGGAYGTQAWIDPVKSRIYLLMLQRANFPNADASPVRQAFQEAAN